MTARKYHSLKQSSLYRIPTRRRLAELLLVTPKELHSSVNLKTFTHIFPRRKKTAASA
jgi:hypothetical protein